MDLLTLANIILSNCRYVSNKKLQKLSYYVYAWYLTIFDKEICSMDFEAWEHGPVCRRLYNKYRRYGWNDIPAYRGFLLASDEDICFVKAVLDVYGDYSADDLEKMSHDERPWNETRKGLKYNEPSAAKIKKELIKDYYGNEEGTKRLIREKFESYVL